MAKSSILTNGNDTLTTKFEEPNLGTLGNLTGINDGIPIKPDSSINPETQYEAVGNLNFNIKNPDQEERNKIGTESGQDENYAEFGSFGVESGFESDEFLLDAIYGSYPELLDRQSTEVIIGADNRVRINPTTSYPWRAICALKITAANGKKFIGTGWLASPRTVITAGHCLYMHAEGGWAKSVEVIPARNDASNPYGSFVGTSFRSTTGWVSSKNRENDYGAIILPTNMRPGATVGYFGMAVRDNNFLNNAALNLSGYPGDKGGNQQWFMAQKPKSLSSRVIYYDIDTYGGQSGSPVWVLQNGNRYAVGIHTNGASSGNSATRIENNVYANLLNWKNLGA